jgi:bifunctional DNA-binding transcriptional regulator/antitoxin component of YhaV-PrlF toxin-antitoxin module
MASSRSQSRLAGEPSKNQRMREMHAAGRSCSEIAKELGVSYQRVYNVVGNPAKRGERSPNVEPNMPGDGERKRFRLKVGPGGRIVIPVDVREAMKLQEGSTALAWLEKGELRLVSPEISARHAQEIARELLGEVGSLADELIADRRQEVKRESSSG